MQVPSLGLEDHLEKGMATTPVFKGCWGLDFQVEGRRQLLARRLRAVTFLGSQESSQVFIRYTLVTCSFKESCPILFSSRQTLLMRWGSLNGFSKNVLHQASPGLTTIG